MSKAFTIVAAVVLVLQAATACAGQSGPTSVSQRAGAEKASPQVNAHAQVLQEFKQRVEAYVQMRNKADDGVPKQKQTNEPADIKNAQDGLAKRIMSARAGAKRGEIFTPEIATHFRRLVRPEVKDADTKQLIQDDNPGAIPFKVNGPYPSDAPLSTVPPNVLASLPELPMEIEYRFIGKHLILRDARANIVIDYMPNVLS
jgi:hypothetical protein